MKTCGICGANHDPRTSWCGEQSRKACTCTVTGPDYEQTTFDPACSYHGDNGTMVVRVPVRRVNAR